MVTGIIVPGETHKALRKAEFAELVDYQTAVGGSIETIQVQSHPMVIIANEDGKLRELPINLRATLLWRVLNPQGIRGDLLVGDVVIVGPISFGELTEVNPRLISLLIETRRFAIKVKLNEQSDPWLPFGDPMDDFFMAAARAVRLIEDSNPPASVKVVAVA